MSTVKIPLVKPSPREDAVEIYRAFKGRGCDGAAIISILAHRDAKHRSQIPQDYEALYSEEFKKRLSSEVSGHFRKALMLWMLEPDERDAKILRNSLKGTVPDHRATAEIICTRNSSQMRRLKQAYFSNYGINIEDDIEAKTYGYLKKLLLAYLNTSHYEGPEFDAILVESDAKALQKAAKKYGSNEKIFIQIFSERSRAHLVALSAAYFKMFRKSLKKAIKSEIHHSLSSSKSFYYALIIILLCAENPARYFAKALRKSMKGLGTADTTLIRIIITRCEIDMQYIKIEYQKKYGKTLNDHVRSDTSGHYKNFLISLLGPNH